LPENHNLELLPLIFFGDRGSGGRWWWKGSVLR